MFYLSKLHTTSSIAKKASDQNSKCDVHSASLFQDQRILQFHLVHKYKAAVMMRNILTTNALLPSSIVSHSAKNYIFLGQEF